MTMAPAPQPPAAGCPTAVAAAGVALLAQCASFVRLVAGRPEGYASPSSVLPGGTIGKHIRHALDHYRAALDAFDRSTVIDYDHRERNVPMESAPEHALAAIRDLTERLSALGIRDLGQPVRVRVMLSGSGDEAELLSTLGRELAFATHHAVHHHAMMAAMASEFGIHPGPDFGKAPSTICHEQGQR
jgi:uncharacterized damage-inducible protein DinB